MRKYITLFFSASLFLFSCNGDKVPAGIIEQERMTNLLMEVHIVDGGLYGIVQSPDSLKKYGMVRYVALFKRYRTDTTQFRKSMAFYSQRPEELQKMYEQIMANLKMKTDSLNKEQVKKANSNNQKRPDVIPPK